MIQIPFGTNNFAENPEPRLPCILLLDTSGSMAGAPIAELNAGLATYRDSLLADELASKRVEVSIVTFGGPVRCVVEFTTADSFHPPVLQAGGDTPMGAAVVFAADMLRQRKESYRAHGISYFRPWIFLITDGEPTDTWQFAAQQIREGETTKALSFFTVGVAGANFGTLKQIGVREPLRLQGLRFQDLFLWLSSSQTAVSRSSPGETVPLPAPTGWAAV